MRFIEFGCIGAQGAAVIANSGIIPAYVDDNVKQLLLAASMKFRRISDYMNTQIPYLSSHFIQTLVS